MPTWTLRLLGAMTLESPSGARLLRLGHKGQALLTHVAAQGPVGASRGRLLALLWADHGAEEARNSLRQCLHHVRVELGEAAPALASEADRIVLDESMCEVDTRRFEALAAAGEPAAWQAAATCYSGDLSDASPTEAEFDQWAEVERERLRELAHGVVERLSERTLDAAALDEAMRLARRLLAADPVHEGTSRALMRLCAQAGLRSKVLQAWTECQRALRDELGVEPSEQSTALAAALLGPAAPAVAPRPAPQWVPWTTPPGSPLRAPDEREVLDLMLRGWQLFTTYTAEGHTEARSIYEQVLACVPHHVEARTLLGWTHWFDALGGRTADAEASFRAAASCAERALQAGRGGHAPPYGLMGKVLLWSMRHAEAIEHLRQAVALAPDYAYMHFHLGDATMWSGRPEEALPHLDRALQLDPNDHGVFLTVRGMALWMAGDSRAARAAIESALRRNPSYPWAHGLATVLHAEAGDAAAARSAARAGRRFNRRFSVDYAARVMPFVQPAHRARFVRAWRDAGLPEHEAAEATGRA